MDSEGTPVSVRVFEGNTQDVKTVGDQISVLVKRFGVEEVVFVGDRRLTLQFNHQLCAEDTRLDGCYVIKTDLPAGDIQAAMIHDRYKDLTQVEWAFRTFKQGHLEIRPTFVQTKAGARGHVFVIMPAYLLERELYRCRQNLDITVAEGIDELGSLRGVEINIGDVTCQKVPRPVDLSEKLLQAADVHLPDILPLRQVHVATGKKLTESRKTKQYRKLTPQMSQD